MVILIPGSRRVQRGGQMIGVNDKLHVGVRVGHLGVVFIVTSIVGMILGRKLYVRIPARACR